MNTAFLLDSGPKNWGTREEFHYRLSLGLKERGRVAVVVYAEPVPACIRDRMASAGVVVEALSRNDGWGAYYRGVRALARRHQIGIAHIRFFTYFDPVAWIARACGIRRIVYTEANSGNAGAAGWKQEAVRIRGKIMTAPLSRLVGISDFICDRMRLLGVPERKIVRIYNGVDTGRFHPDTRLRDETRRELGIAADETGIIMCCALLEWKRPRIVVDAVSALARAGRSVKLLIAGDGPLKGDLEARAASQGIAGRTVFLGHRADLERLYNASDVFTMASVGEAFGNVTAEAMACGLPVALSDSGANAELVGPDREAGFLAKPDSAESLAAALDRLCADADLRRTMSLAARHRVERIFGIDEAVQRTLAVYDSLEDGRAGQP